jgi:hypothetical protein
VTLSISGPAIYGGGEGEKVRFRQLVVNSVMATDIMDKGRKQTGMLAGARLLPSSRRKSRSIVINRKATIVMKLIKLRMSLTQCSTGVYHCNGTCSKKRTRHI